MMNPAAARPTADQNSEPNEVGSTLAASSLPPAFHGQTLRSDPAMKPMRTATVRSWNFRNSQLRSRTNELIPRTMPTTKRARISRFCPKLVPVFSSLTAFST